MVFSIIVGRFYSFFILRKEIEKRKPRCSAFFAFNAILNLIYIKSHKYLIYSKFVFIC